MRIQADKGRLLRKLMSHCAAEAPCFWLNLGQFACACGRCFENIEALLRLRARKLGPAAARCPRFCARPVAANESTRSGEICRYHVDIWSGARLYGSMVVAEVGQPKRARQGVRLSAADSEMLSRDIFLHGKRRRRPNRGPCAKLSAAVPAPHI